MSQTTSVRRPNPGRRGALLPTLVVLLVIVLLFVLFTNIWTDKLWFDSLDFPQVFATTFWVRVGLFACFGVLMALILIGNMWLAHRLRPRSRRAAHNPMMDRYREAFEDRSVQVMLVLGGVTALFAGIAAASELTTYLAWRNATPFGSTDPRFGLDISFFVFSYPWWRFVIGFAIVALALAAASSALVHYLLGGLQLSRKPAQRSARAAQVHVSVLLGLTMLGFAVSAWFDRFGYETTTNSLLTGLSYTDDHARISASMVVAVVTTICAVLFWANIFLRRWVIPVAAVVLALLAQVLLSVIYPAGVQALEVGPNEPDKERPYIERHIAATRAAYGVDQVQTTDFSANTQAGAGQLRQDAAALPGIRLMDPAVIGPTFEQLQQVRGYYSFPSVLDVDRYPVQGQETDAVVAVRELNLNGLQDKSWNNIRTSYTHGYGLVAAYGNKRQAAGEPDWLVKNMPPESQLGNFEPRIYFGEEHDEYSIVGAPAGQAPVEIDTPQGGQGGGETKNTYAGRGGVPIGNWFSRLLYATRFADANIVLSRRVNPESKIIYDRTPKERVQAAAPWLTVDSNAYPAVVDGRVVWVVDGYTTTENYPNSHKMSMQQAISDTQTQKTNSTVTTPDTQINYIRNSVKAVVDAYDGTVHLYAWDEQDPILKTWRKAFPNTVSDRSTIPPALLEHLRYPDDLFKVQRDLLTRYHVTDPYAWFQQNDLWVVPEDPVNKDGQNNAQKENPYLLSIRWPGDDHPVFSQTSVFVPRGRNNLAAYFAVNADAASPDYGKMRVLRMTGAQIDGPSQSYNAMVTNEKVAIQLRPYLNQGSAQVTYGNLLTLPLGGGLLYAQPIYTQKSGQGAYPALTFVTVRFGEKVGIGTTLQEALDQVFAGNSGASTGEDGQQTTPAPTDPTQPGQQTPQGEQAANQALKEADKAFADAGQALSAGDLGTYQKKNDEAHAAVRRALQAMGG